jgi:uncharacterized membrane protein YhiD involved in acid resistance
MTWLEFSVRLGAALLLGGIIGVERQWRQRGVFLGTNVLVSMGAAMFVMLSVMTSGDSSPTRIAAQVVSGIGFLGGGVIVREGVSVRGLDTSATLWCAAALGCLCGAGFQQQAFIGLLAILVSNVLLRPLANKINRQSVKTIKQSSDHWGVTNEPKPKIEQDVKLDPEFAAAYNSYREEGWSSLGSRPGAIGDINQSDVDSFKHEQEREDRHQQTALKNPMPNPTTNPRLDVSNDCNQNSKGRSKKVTSASPRRMSNVNPKLELATAYFNLGSTRVQLDDRKGAIADLQKAAKLYLALSDRTQYMRTVELLKKIQ